MESTDDIARYLANLQSEIGGAAIYSALSDAEQVPEPSEVSRRLADTERRHSQVWKDNPRDTGVAIPADRPSWRARTLSRLARWFGPQIVLPIIRQQEQIDESAYDNQEDARAAGLPVAERSHARLLALISADPQRRRHQRLLTDQTRETTKRLRTSR